MTRYITLPQTLLWSKMKQSSAPAAFTLELTARCNNDCRHCYVNLPVHDHQAQRQELTLAEIDRLTDEAVELGALWCLLSGGEPLLRSDFEEIYLRLRQKGLLLSLYTNATLIRPRHIKLLLEHPPREIEVTVYGVTQATYEAVTRVPGSFSQFQRGLQLLFDHQIPVRLKSMSLRSNVHEHQAIADFCRRHTKDYYRFDPFLNLRFDNNAKRNQEIVAERLTAEEIVALELADGARFDELRNKCSRNAGEVCTNGCTHLFHCGAGLSTFDISYDGRFRLCLCLNAPGMTYNLRTGHLWEAWPAFVDQVRDARSDLPEYLTTCRSCPLRNLCYWCPAVSHLETGRLDTRIDYFCHLAHQRAAAIKTGLAAESSQASQQPAAAIP